MDFKSKQAFSLEEIPSVLYQLLDQFLTSSGLLNLVDLADYDELENKIVASGYPSLFLSKNDQTLDLFYEQTSKQERVFLTVKVDPKTQQVYVLYLKQPYKLVFDYQTSQKPTEAQFYTLGWFIWLLNKGYKVKN